VAPISLSILHHSSHLRHINLWLGRKSFEYTYNTSTLQVWFKLSLHQTKAIHNDCTCSKWRAPWTRCCFAERGSAILQQCRSLIWNYCKSLWSLLNTRTTYYCFRISNTVKTPAAKRLISVLINFCQLSLNLLPFPPPLPSLKNHSPHLISVHSDSPIDWNGAIIAGICWRVGIGKTPFAERISLRWSLSPFGWIGGRILILWIIEVDVVIALRQRDFEWSEGEIHVMELHSTNTIQLYLLTVGFLRSCQWWGASCRWTPLRIQSFSDPKLLRTLTNQSHPAVNSLSMSLEELHCSRPNWSLFLSKMLFTVK